MKVGGCGLNSPDVYFLQKLKKLEETNAESKQVEILELKVELVDTKSVREKARVAR